MLPTGGNSELAEDVRLVTANVAPLYRKTMRDSGYDEEQVARNVANSWVWRNIFVAETDAEAERLAIPAFKTQSEFRMAMRKKVYEEQGLFLKKESGGPAARNVVQSAVLCGSPATVAEAIAEIDKIGVGGLILTFRIGPMPYDVAASSIPTSITAFFNLAIASLSLRLNG